MSHWKYFERKLNKESVKYNNLITFFKKKISFFLQYKTPKNTPNHKISLKFMNFGSIDRHNNTAKSYRKHITLINFFRIWIEVIYYYTEYLKLRVHSFGNISGTSEIFITLFTFLVLKSHILR